MTAQNTNSELNPGSMESEQAFDVTILHPPEIPGWQVTLYDDGSGSFKSPEGVAHLYDFDKSTGEYMGEHGHYTDFYDDPGPPSYGDRDLVEKIIHHIAERDLKGAGIKNTYLADLKKANTPEAVIEAVGNYACTRHSAQKYYSEEYLALGELGTLRNHPVMQGFTREIIEERLCNWLRQRDIPLPGIENEAKLYESDTKIASGSLIKQFGEYKKEVAAEVAKVDRLAEEELKDFHNTIKGFIQTGEKQIAQLDRRLLYRTLHKQEYEADRKALAQDLLMTKQQLTYTVDDIKRDIMPDAYTDAHAAVPRPTYTSYGKAQPVSTLAEAEAITKLKRETVLNPDNAARYQRCCSYLGKEPVDISTLKNAPAKQPVPNVATHYRKLCQQQNSKQTNKKEKAAEQEV